MDNKCKLSQKVIEARDTKINLFAEKFHNLIEEYEVKTINIDFEKVFKNNLFSYGNFDFVELPYGEVGLCRVDKDMDINFLINIFGKATCYHLESIGKAMDFCDKYYEIDLEYENLINLEGDEWLL